MAELMTYDLHPDVLAFTAGRGVELPCPVVQMHQVHNVQVARVDSPDVSRDELQGFDALITNVRGVCIGARSADCIPVLLYDPVTRSAAAIHSGWRGTVTGVCRRTITRMEIEYGTRASDMVAVIGPGVCRNCFQVGHSPPVSSESKPLVKWTGNAVDLVEMVYGICVMGSVNDGDVKFKDLAQAMYQFFGIKAKDCYRFYTDIRRRKNHSRTYFLDRMQEKLNDKMRKDDELERMRR